MTSLHDAEARAVRLTQDLVRINTAGANEAEAASLLCPMLEAAGFRIRITHLAADRPNIVADFNGGGSLVFSGHLDTVPYNEADWYTHPLEPETDGDRLNGRGSSDMKAGVAAMVSSALSHVARTPHGPGFTIALSSGEETGCEGATLLAQSKQIAQNPILIVGEATANHVLYGHKGATWLKAVNRGIAAHGSRPELGTNAIEGLITALADLQSFSPAHTGLGLPTKNLGTFSGGTQPNLVPDRAELTLDIRTIPGFDASAIEHRMNESLPNGEVQRLLDLPPVWTDPHSGLSHQLRNLVRQVTTEEQPLHGAAYFTDAAVLSSDPPRTYIIGPGDPEQPHTANESCSIHRIHEATDIYGQILAEWSSGQWPSR